MKPIKLLFLFLLFQCFLLSANAFSTFYSHSAADPVDQICAQSPNLNPTVVRDAIVAYDCALARGISDPRHIITIVDYSLPSTKKRLWVVDLWNRKVLLNTYVAHAENSGGMVPDYFSNQPDSHASSLGLYQTGMPYFGQFGYAVRLFGLEPGFNSNAYTRAIVVHGSYYLDPNVMRQHNGLPGRSWGCFAVPPQKIITLANTISHGTLLFAYSSQSAWLRQSQFLHCNIT